MPTCPSDKHLHIKRVETMQPDTHSELVTIIAPDKCNITAFLMATYPSERQFQTDSSTDVNLRSNFSCLLGVIRRIVANESPAVKTVLYDQGPRRVKFGSVRQCAVTAIRQVKVQQLAVPVTKGAAVYQSSNAVTTPAVTFYQLPEYLRVKRREIQGNYMYMHTRVIVVSPSVGYAHENIVR